MVKTKIRVNTTVKQETVKLAGRPPEIRKKQSITYRFSEEAWPC